MKIDYSKKDFTQEEKEILFEEIKTIKLKKPNYIPILIQIDSNVLSIDKYKFLVNEDIAFNDFINGTLKKTLVNLHKNDILQISVINFSGLNKCIIIEPQSKTIKQFYKEYLDPETNFLILKISRYTSYKWIKNGLFYYIGF